MKRFLTTIGLALCLLASYPEDTDAKEGRFTFYGNLAATSQAGNDFSLTENVSGAFGFGVKYAMDGNNSFRVLAGLRRVEMPLTDGPGMGKVQSAQIGLEKVYDLRFKKGFLQNTSLVLRISGSDAMNDSDDFDLVGGIGIEKKLNVEKGAATISVMPYMDITDVEGGNIISIGFQFNIRPPIQ